MKSKTIIQSLSVAALIGVALFSVSGSAAGADSTPVPAPVTTRHTAVRVPDFTFDVPVRLYNIPTHEGYDVTVSVRCRVYSSSGITIGDAYRWHRIPASGIYTETMRIEVNADPGKDPVTAVRYGCEMQVRGLLYVDASGREREAPAIRPRADTTPVTMVSGPIP